MFSSRFPPELAPNALARAVQRARKSGATLLDLTETNPTAVGLAYPDDLPAAFADRRVLSYRPDPLGAVEARDAVARTYVERGAAIDGGQVALTSSTSEAYSALFKLFCNPGDAVLVPQPSYPLFDLLARFEAVQAVPYRLRLSDDWAIDRDSVLRALTPAARLLLVVSPNNPTGSMLRHDDREWLVSVADKHDIPLVSDEVFLDYPLSVRSRSASLAGEDRVLTFTLGGLSKSAGLPQAKLAWIAVSGPQIARRASIERLAIVLDTFLTVSTGVQVAAERLIEFGRAIRATIRDRLAANLDTLERCVRSHSTLTLLQPEGGWSAVLRVPAVESEERIVLDLVNETGVLVHPGYFFDFPDEAFLVLSLLPESRVFEDGVSRLVKRIALTPSS